MNIVDIAVGAEVILERTISESDIYLYAGITGDLSPNHINEKYMSGGRYKHRVAHGTLLVGLMSAASSKMYVGRSVSYGYDRIRFIAPVFIGDTITVEYTLQRKDIENGFLYCDVTCTNQHDQTVAVATHIKKVLDDGETDGNSAAK